MRRRISWLVVATTSTVVVSFVIPLCLLVQTLAADRAMAAADQEARNVAILVAGLHDSPQLAELVAGIDQRGQSATTVLTSDGRQLGSGPRMSDDAEVRRALAGEAFTTVDADGGRVLLPVVVSDGTAVIRTSVTEADLRHGVTSAWLGIVGLGLVLLALALVIATMLGHRISRPLLGVAQTAHRLRAGELTARAEVRGTVETQELAQALNGLAERTVELLAHERAAVGDLSHRLRTPVTALRLDAESVDDPSLAERLQEHIAVLQRTIDSIVKEARRPVRTDLAPLSDATDAVRGRLAFWEPLAEDQHRTMAVRLPTGPLLVPLAVDDLTDVVDVLVDNIFAHTPEGTPFAVALRLDGGLDGRLDGDTAVLLVTDGGAGPSGVRRNLGTSGLGLDIVRRTATGCGGRVRVGTAPEGGMLVEVTLPLVPG